METFIALLGPVLVDALLPLIGAAVTAVIGMAADQLRRKFKNENLDSALARVEHLAELAVADVNQTMIPLVREVMDDGKITPAEAKRLKDAATGKIVNMLGAKGTKEVEAMGVDVDAMLASVVEAKVNQSRTR